MIPETVTKIEDGVGSYNSITKVDSRIGAFSDNNLTFLTIPDSVTYIGTWAFAKNKIGSLLLGSNVEQSAFIHFIITVYMFWIYLTQCECYLMVLLNITQ